MEVDIKNGDVEVVKYAPQKKYDKQHTVQIKMKLNKNTDADIIEHLESLDNKQGYLKKLIRQDMERSENK